MPVNLIYVGGRFSSQEQANRAIGLTALSAKRSRQPMTDRQGTANSFRTTANID